jgi:hypothetical protein
VRQPPGRTEPRTSLRLHPSLVKHGWKHNRLGYDANLLRVWPDCAARDFTRKVLIMGQNESAARKPEPELASSSVLFRAFQSFEHRSGKMLVKAIKANSKEKVDEAVEFARREFVKPRTKGVANPSEFDDMTRGLLNYLQQDTDVGDGQLFTQTPLAFARHCKANEAEKAIQSHIDRLNIKGSTSKTVGEVSASRAELAKERLKAFQATK